MDIHPACKIGKGVVFDHAVGIVIGETSVVGDYSTLFHNVTLGATSREKELDRHPKLGEGVVIGAGASVLGNIKIGRGSMVGANSVVLKEVPDMHTAVGIPAKIFPQRQV